MFKQNDVVSFERSLSISHVISRQFCTTSYLLRFQPLKNCDRLGFSCQGRVVCFAIQNSVMM